MKTMQDLHYQTPRGSLSSMHIWEDFNSTSSNEIMGTVVAATRHRESSKGHTQHISQTPFEKIILVSRSHST